VRLCYSASRVFAREVPGLDQIVTQNISLKVADGSTMNAYVARPARAAKHPGILVFQEAFGVNAHIRNVADRFAKIGVVAIAPELFHRTVSGFDAPYEDFSSTVPHMKAMTYEGNIEDARAAYEFLRNDGGVQPDRIASIGFCMGGRVSFLACTTLPVQAAISFYGGGIAPALLPRVPQLNAPILFCWGGKDKHIGKEQRQAIADDCNKAGKPFVNVDFSDADHGFFCDARPTYHPAVAALAWNLVESFLYLHVKEPQKRSRVR
jgi:carboxymethylenebutenolidase